MSQLDHSTLPKQGTFDASFAEDGKTSRASYASSTRTHWIRVICLPLALPPVHERIRKSLLALACQHDSLCGP